MEKNKDNWISIENATIDYVFNSNIDNVNSIHCDTRDFYILFSTWSKKSQSYKIKYPNSIINKNEIINFLKELNNKTKDKIEELNEWRYITNNKEKLSTDNWRYKYIRMYKINIDEFVVLDAYENPIDYKSLLENAKRID